MRSALFWDFTERRLVVPCRRFGRTFGGFGILTAVLMRIQVIWDVLPCRLVNLPSSSGPAVQDDGTTGHIFHSVRYDTLKLWLTPISAQFYGLCILSITCRS